MNDKPDGIWHYTTINIPQGVTVTFTRNAANTPVVWLASGSVTIAGTINLNGNTGTGDVTPGGEALGGPGGFRGGLGSRGIGFPVPVPATPGEGPGGGLPGTQPDACGGGGGHATVGGGIDMAETAIGGPMYGNILLQPLVGGSGGGGSFASSSNNGGNGGGGGGTILIASSSVIRFTGGTITADGGQGACCTGSGGSGGSIRLVANRIEENGTLAANGGFGYCNNSGSVGRIRLEAFFTTAGLSVSPVSIAGPPLSVGAITQDALGTIRITDVAGLAVPHPPSGNTSVPDVLFSAGIIDISLATTNIPIGTRLTVRIATGGQVIQVQSTPTDAMGNASATATVPGGIGTIQAFAEYIPPRP